MPGERLPMRKIRDVLRLHAAGLSKRRITVSTVGLPAKMRELAELGTPYNLAVSLHAPNDELRTMTRDSNEFFGESPLTRPPWHRNRRPQPCWYQEEPGCAPVRHHTLGSPPAAADQFHPGRCPDRAIDPAVRVH